MKHFTPKLWLGMTATPDKRDDNVEGRNVYELFNYQIAYQIRDGNGGKQMIAQMSKKSKIYHRPSCKISSI